jgi:transcriptional regulator with XRE-family HTH domain
MKRSKFAPAFAKAVRRVRLKAGMSQERLAEAASVHPVYVSLIETGKRVPTIEVAYRVARGLRMELSGLVAEAEARPGKPR